MELGSSSVIPRDLVDLRPLFSERRYSAAAAAEFLIIYGEH